MGFGHIYYFTCAHVVTFRDCKSCVPSLHVDEYDDDLEEGALRPVLMAGEEAVPLGDVDVHEEAPDSHEDAEDDHDHEVEVGLQRR